MQHLHEGKSVSPSRRTGTRESFADTESKHSRYFAGNNKTVNANYKTIM